jgi:mono/diheme cytochrome c family protein
LLIPFLGRDRGATRHRQSDEANTVHSLRTHARFAGIWFLILDLNLLLISGVQAAQPPEDDPDIPAPGLLATFTPPGADEPAAVRVEAELAARWGSGSPDVRVPADGFRCRFGGSLLVQAPGRYTFFARTDGSVRLTVGGKDFLSGSGAGVVSSPGDLPAGFAPMVLEYAHGRGDAFLAIDWEGPGFAREPLPARLLFHERGSLPQPDRFEEGRRQADRLGCANCHQLLDLPRHPHLGPPLGEAARAIAPEWLDAWLRDPTQVRPRTRMPAFGHGLDAAQAADLAAFLASVASRSRPRESIAEVKMALNVASAEKGRLLFRSVGCLGCHTRGEVPGLPEERFAPDLADIGRKRTASWLTDYLHHPRKSSPSQHRADLRLTSDEAAHLAAYLVTEAPPAAAPPVRAGSGGDAARGKELARRLRCAACHEIPGLDPPPPDLPLTAGSPSTAGCLADPAAITGFVPRYTLVEDHRSALRDLVTRLPRHPAATSRQALAGDVVRRRNCLGCHIRDGKGGLTVGPQLAAYLARDPELGELKGMLTPPDLSAVGDKLRPEYLGLAVRGAAPSARPWLAVRMPALTFEPGEAEAIGEYFQDRDRMDQDGSAGRPAPSTRPDAAIFETAVALLGQRGFGCVNCHVLAGKIPPGGEPETLGPDLALAHRRMTERYFDRWIANPQRIIPGSPMPQFLQPVATISGTLDEQLSTLWELLGSTRVAEAAAQGTREILKRQGERALVVRDMVLLPGAPETEYTPRGVAVGLKNDHALLFDTDRLTWLAFWHRGFLSRTKSGRLWEWHPEGDRLWVAASRQPPVVLVNPTGALVPAAVRGRFGHFAELDFAGSDVRLLYALNPPQALALAPLEVAETIRPTQDGWERLVRVETRGLPAGLQPALVVQTPSAAVGAGADRSTFTWKAGADRVRLHVTGARDTRATLPGDATAHLFLLAPATLDNGSARLRLSVEGGR